MAKRRSSNKNTEAEQAQVQTHLIERICIKAQEQQKVVKCGNDKIEECKVCNGRQKEGLQHLKGQEGLLEEMVCG